MWSSFKRKAIFLLAGAACSGMFTTVAHADAIWDPFVIRTVSGATTPVAPVGTSSGSSFSVVIDESGEKAGYGTSYFDGQKLSSVLGVNYTRVDSGTPDPYVNIWVTDGTNSAVIAPVVGMNNTGNYTGGNDVNGLALQTLGFNIYETDFTNLSWLGVTGAQRVNSAVIAGGSGGTVVTLADIGHLTVGDPGVYGSVVGTGAPKNGTGFNLIFGDTQGNFLNPVPYTLANVSVTGEAAAPVPLPAAAWAGMALFGGIGVSKLRRRASNAA